MLVVFSVFDIFAFALAVLVKYISFAVESSSNIALFENLDSISTVLRLAALVLVVFSVFNIFALKAQAISEEK